MEPIDPISLAIVAVGVAVVLSALLLLLFATREEKYEDVVLAQKQEQDAVLGRTSTTKVTKQRKKPPRGKKKGSEHDSDGVPSSYTGEEVDVGVEEERLLSMAEPNSILEEEPAVKPTLKERKEGKKKPKKKSSNDATHSVFDRHAHFSVEGGKPLEEEEIVVEQIPDSDVDLEALPDLPEENTAVEESVISSEPPPPKKSKAKSKPQIPKEKTVKSGDAVSVKHLRDTVSSANLGPGELQGLIDILLNKQGESNQWQMTSSKADPVESLKKQLQEKDILVKEEQQQVQSSAVKMKELRDELHQERSKLKNQQENATKKITAQGKEIQALQERMTATHNTHRMDTQNLMSQIHKLKEQINNSAIGNVQRLQEENSHMKTASMRATQLTADNESLTQELNKLQQTHRQLKTDLTARIDQLKQTDVQQQNLEGQIHQLNLDNSKRKEAENALAKRLSEVNGELKKAEGKSTMVSHDLNNATQALHSEESRSAELANKVKKMEQLEKDVGTMSAKLSESSRKVAELDTLHAGMRNQLKEAEEKHLLKDKEIQVLHDELKVVQVTQAQSYAAVPNHNDEQTNDAVSRLEDTLRENESAIAQMTSDASKADEEIESLRSQMEQMRQKNNELRTKNWKAMEALSSAEKSTRQQISKACEAVKEENDANLEKSLDRERSHVQEMLCKLHPGITVDRSLTYTVWIKQFQEKVSEHMNSTVTGDTSEKDEEIARLTTDVESKKEEVKKVEKIIEQQKQKNNDLREKNWKAMDALTESEKSAGSQIKKAVQSVKEEKDKALQLDRSRAKEVLCKIHPDVTVDASLTYVKWLVEFEKNALQTGGSDTKERDDLARQLEETQEALRTLQEEESGLKKSRDDLARQLEETREALRTLQEEESGLKKSRDDLARQLEETREALRTLQEEESGLKKSRDDLARQLEETREALRTLQEEESGLKKSLDDLERQLEETQETNVSLVAECDHYKSGLEDTESMLRKLENNVEAEMTNYGIQLDQAQVDLGKSTERIERLEQDLMKATSATKSQAENISSLEGKLQRSSAAEADDKKRIAFLEGDLAKVQASSSQDSRNLAEMQKELTKENENVKELNEKLAKLVATKTKAEPVKSELDGKPVPPEEENKLRLELSATKTQLEEKVMQVGEKELLLKTVQEELKRVQANEDRISRASTDFEESNEAVNGSPEKTEKKKKGLKGAFNKFTGSKKDKESKGVDKEKMVAQLDEAQKQISASKSQIEELRTEKASLEKQNVELKRLSLTVGDSMTKSQQIAQDIGEAMADTANSPVKPRPSVKQHALGGSGSSARGPQV